MRNHVYVFDLDETLINGDCAMIWNQFLVNKEVITTPDFLKEDRRLMTLYAQGKLDMAQYLNFAMSPLLTMPIKQIEQLVDECLDNCILPMLFPEAERLITQLKQQQSDTLIVSASVSFIVKKVAQRLGINDALAIDLQCKQGYYLPDIEGIATYREGKVTRLKQWLHLNHKSDAHITFYTDSINDLSMCLHADDVVLINPCSQLKEAANNYPQWTICAWGQ
ncbi:HAD family hydrolase [Aliivibrio kagoshimensis]|uniref:HAD family hydrolase n=1 Tax=Aliivibrio kagoshimensis TaxID=2910230 RepID=UPI003D0FCF16